MLIPSPRHKEADLELWQEYEAADLISGRKLQPKIDAAISVIREFARTPCYCGVSWGKDSTVLFELLQVACPAVQAYWMVYGRATNPECRAVRDAMLARWPRAKYQEIDVGEDEQARDDYSLAVKAAGTNRYLSGVRGEESGIRRMVMRYWGHNTERTCRPLGWWKQSDIFGFLATYQLPVHPNYGMLGGGRWPREQIRTASIGGERGSERGRTAWEQEYYGDVLRRLQANQ